MSDDLAQLTRELSEAEGGDATMRFYRADAVYDMSQTGMGLFEGCTAIRAFLDEWDGRYEEYEDERLEIRDLGGGVVFAVIRQNARPRGAPPHVRMRDVYGYVFVWVGDKIARVIVYADPDEARAAAERLAEERG